jgi:hypothetical protein
MKFQAMGTLALLRMKVSHFAVHVRDFGFLPMGTYMAACPTPNVTISINFSGNLSILR